MKKPMRVAVTGAAGNIGYALSFRIAAGDMLGPDQPVILQLIEIPPALEALKADEAGVTGIGAATARREGTAALPCPACGPRPEADAVFCSNCGRQLGRIAS